MALGMSYNEYWNEPPILARYYRKADEIRNDKKNEELWLQGMYFYEAVAVALANGFGKKGQKPKKYTEKPYKIREDTKEEKAKKAEQERQKAIRYFEKLMASHKGKEVGQNGNS